MVNIVDRIKAVGQEIIDRAEEIAVGENMTGTLSIHAYLDRGETMCDTIEWHKEVINKNSYKLYIKGE